MQPNRTLRRRVYQRAKLCLTHVGRLPPPMPSPSSRISAYRNR
jgi:hypothetical protein